jgi:two-component system sensor histidine kinase BarA
VKTPSIDQIRNNVLIVEDDAATVSILNIWLRNKCQIYQARDGDEALQIVHDLMKENQKIDLFIFDISLPRPWTGITLKVEIIERWNLYKAHPFIAETAFAMPLDQEQIIRAGFIEYLTKPLDKSILVQTVEKYLNI